MPETLEEMKEREICMAVTGIKIKMLTQGLGISYTENQET
jgi:hypothetical protein